MEEIWKPIVGYEGLYEISNLGQVKSLERISYTKSNKIRYVHERILKQQLSWDGYLDCWLSINGSGRSFRVHRLVAEAFIPNPNNYLQVNHIDGNKKNNCVDNLEWCTCLQNMQHAKSIGLLKPASPEGSRKRTNAMIEVMGIKVYIVETNEHFRSITECADRLNVAYTTLIDCLVENRICNGYHVKLESKDSKVWLDKKKQKNLESKKYQGRCCMCITTNQYFSSVTQAGKILGLPNLLQTMHRNGYDNILNYKGYEFKIISPEEYYKATGYVASAKIYRCSES